MWFCDTFLGCPTKAYTGLGRAAIRNGSYQIALVTALLILVASKLKNNAGLPESFQVKSLSHRRSIFQTNWEPSPGADTSTQVMSGCSDRNCRSVRKSSALGKNETIGTTCPKVRKDSAGRSSDSPPSRTRSARTVTPRCAPEE